jgi:hypothetical protein
MTEDDVRRTLARTRARFAGRHRDLDSTLECNLGLPAHRLGAETGVSAARLRLIGAYFPQQYALGAAIPRCGSRPFIVVGGCRAAGATPGSRQTAAPEPEAHAGMSRPPGDRRPGPAAAKTAAGEPAGDPGHAAALAPAARPVVGLSFAGRTPNALISPAMSPTRPGGDLHAAECAVGRRRPIAGVASPRCRGGWDRMGLSSASAFQPGNPVLRSSGGRRSGFAIFAVSRLHSADSPRCGRRTW